MAKYIIDIEDDAKDGLYKAKNFNTLVFYKEELDRLEPYEELEKPEEKKPWRAGNNEQYYYIDSGLDVSNDIEQYFGPDISRYKIGNYYKTREEAQKVAERLKVYAELKRFAVPDDEQVWDCDSKYYYIYYFAKNKTIKIDHTLMYNAGCLYFSSKEQVEKAFDTVGADRIKRYYFGIED